MLKKIALSTLLLGCTFHAVQESTSVVKLDNFKTIKLLLLKDDAIRAVTDVEKQYDGVVKTFFFPALDLGMSNVPVLDQGAEGTCVTFATTAALDALLGEGDFISQQCTLELNVALGNDYWNGAWQGAEIIDPLQKYGVVSQQNCPDKYPKSSAKIDLKTYSSLVSGPESAVISGVEYEYFENANLDAVKRAIDQGHRVLIGFRVYAYANEAVMGFNVNGYRGGLWACQQGKSQNYCKNSNAGHEVVVVGYDSDQQLLKIRNSWGAGVGENGDYYMTYKFFNSMGINQTVVK